MKNVLLFLFIIGQTSCLGDIELNLDFSSCDKPSRLIEARTVDFYTKKAVPNVKFQLYEQTLSLWGPTLIQELATDPNGLAMTAFESVPTAISYYVKVLPNSDTSYIFPWASIRFQHFECSKNWLILMKPVQDLNLTIENNGPLALGKRSFYVTRDSRVKSIGYLNQDISGDYSFGQITVDTIPVGFEEKFIVKVVPEEQIRISYYDSSNSLKTVEFLTAKSNISYYTLTL